jgi:outer membrane protein OmpA-like peptidoglycan-associated protein
MRRTVSCLGCLGIAIVVFACASTQQPASLGQAQAIYGSLEKEQAEQRVEGDMIRTRAVIDTATRAVSQGMNQGYVNAMSDIALRMAQMTQEDNQRVIAERAADSLQHVRVNRLSKQLALAQVQRESLQAQNAATMARNDSLRRAADSANAQLSQAMAQLQSLVVEITNLRETPRGLVISLSDILFDVGKATLKPGAEQNVRKISTVLKQYPDHKISVEGYTDATGSDVFNQRLSEDRSAAVRAALVSGGIDPSMITSNGFGKANPVATNATAAGRQANRRVEIVVLGAGKLADSAVANGGQPARDTTAAAAAAGAGAGAAPDTTHKP